MRFGSRTLGVILAGAMMMLSGGYATADETPAATIKTRHDGFKDLGSQMKAIVDQIKGRTLDRAVMTDAAKKIATIAPEIVKWFPKGSGPESGVKTLAKSEIWTKPADFQAAADKLPPEADKLVQVVAAGDAAAIGAQLQATGQACKGCHKPFRNPPADEQ